MSTTIEQEIRNNLNAALRLLQSEEEPLNKPTSFTGPFQKIYFGSPGTGKSFRVKKEIKKVRVKHPDVVSVLTTFHPDTDYASFVGAYKPLLKKAQSEETVYEEEELAEIFKRDVLPSKDKGTEHQEAKIKFGLDHCQHFGGRLADYDINHILELAGEELEDNGSNNRRGKTYVSYGVNVGLSKKETKGNSNIIYEFVPQVFTNAYVEAWNKLEEGIPVYLVIEEINRGNCAQIFGDLFQLLDRNNLGYSEYPVKADTDLKNYLTDLDGWNAKHPGIKNGYLCLPPNLYIIATMNTSDQSLFPMDSAFKRRWEWKFVPTCVKSEEEHVMRAQNIKASTLYRNDTEEFFMSDGLWEYNWSEFLSKINACIETATKSDDKKLGFWFVKTPARSNKISVDTFVSKVLFYLWNDVFKDFGPKKTNPFAIKDAKGERHVQAFSSYFNEVTGELELGKIHSFMYNLGLNPKLIDEAQEATDEQLKAEGPPAEE